ncbi:putative RSM22-mitochondrial ribosomal protein, small subunit [Fusarium fujikuroi]|nr:putative RSM22-mitochondrial ribosomal protein, small subunit [Fusarium fujikuroi]
MGPQPPRPDNEGIVLRELEGGEFEEVAYEIPFNEGVEDINEPTPEPDLEDRAIDQIVPGYVDLVARSQREYDALQKLSEDFKVAQQKQQEAENEAAAQEELEMEQLEEDTKATWPEEYEQTNSHRSRQECR